MIGWQILIFAIPSIATLFVWWMSWFSGYKTTLNSWGTFITGLEMIAFGSFVPEWATAALVPGFAVAALISNSSFVTHRR